MVNAASNHAPNGIYIALGANQAYRGRGPLENLNSALAALVGDELHVVRCSRPWRTPAWPNPSDPPFVNAAAELACALSPDALLARLHAVEARFGRMRGQRNAPRSIDLDLIDFQGAVRRGGEPDLTLPHPRAAGRAFVLLPLREIAPRWRDPVSGVSVDRLIAALPHADRSACRPAGGVFCAAGPG
jgi:2-amino-4-hydroxy-6-hydroxymethyldihydropteridine diphosphokinase